MSSPLVIVYNNVPSDGTTVVSIPLSPGDVTINGAVLTSVDWGDESTADTSYTHAYTSSGPFTITITASDFTSFYYSNADDAQYLTAVNSFGSLPFTMFFGAFKNAVNLTAVPASLPSTVYDLESAFEGASLFNGDITGWNTTNVTNMSKMFKDATLFNQNIGSWVTTNVTNMSDMFNNAGVFNQNIGNWNTQNVTNMSGMFSDSSGYNQVFNQPISFWNVSNVTNFDNMFKNNQAFNQDLQLWQLSGGTGGTVSCSNMFLNCINFNNGATAGVSGNAPFATQATTGTITNFSNMFSGCTSFNRAISTWKYTAITDATNFLSGAKSFSITNYNNLLVALGTASPSLPSNKVFTNTGLIYHGDAAVNARNTLLNTFNWTIGGDVLISQNPPIQNTPFTVTLSGSMAALSTASPPLLPDISYDLAIKRKNSGYLSPQVKYTSSGGIDTLVITNVIIPTSGLILDLSIVDVTSGDVDVVSLNRLLIEAAPAARTPCFLEGSQILCYIDDKETYLPIEQMKPGTLVKTLLNGYKKVVLIGKGVIQNPATNERLKNRLYTCSTANYPELTNDLVLTGCHSILVEEITDKQRAETMRLLGRMFATDDKYRLMACIDERAEPLTTEGAYTIWHFALEHDDQFMNYGVFANGGLLVETCSQRNMRNNSNLVIQ